ncbi:hypothetical protein CASFOL_004207 [Castilleja foliolosa]|uniref:Myosin motor domain-containing protein n=1 Tax=Castilleja foliolosa TaxID=1961234 RepID=A0ABD3EDJ7_9LAMI
MQTKDYNNISTVTYSNWSKRECMQDGIDWAKVEFEDNQDCLNLFEKKPLGLQSLLDEESTFPNGTDLSFANKLKHHLKSKPCFRGERGKAFTVRHYAGDCTARRYGFLLLKHVASKDPLSVSVAILHQFNILPEMYQVGYTKLFFRTGQIGVLEDTRNRTLHGILRVQSCFRGHKARCLLREIKRGIATLQSFIQKHVKSRTSKKEFQRLNEASAVLQSVIRGWLVRRCNGDAGLLQFVGGKGNKSEQVLVSSSFLRGESALRDKHEENSILQQQFENRTLVRVRAQNEVHGGRTKCDHFSRSRHKQQQQQHLEHSSSSIGRLAQEFEQRSQVFGDDAKFLVEVKTGKAEASLDPDNELWRLKHTFEAWKEDYGVRLRETKVILNKLGEEQGGEEGSAADKLSKSWWGRRNRTAQGLIN